MHQGIFHELASTALRYYGALPIYFIFIFLMFIVWVKKKRQLKLLRTLLCRQSSGRSQ